ncbi:MAG: ABC transporter permease [Solirubrobacterales bacterium]|nr:ABC transporter permease [Solirubrobacterales bacterium]
MVLLASLARFYVVRVRRRLVHELLAVLGIAVGVALVFAALVANTTLTSAMTTLTKGVVGETASLQMSARGPEGFPEQILTRVERTAGVVAAAPVLESRVNIVGPKGRRSVLMIGSDPRFARIAGPLLRPFTDINRNTVTAIGRQKIVGVPAPIARDLGISFGAPLRIETEARIVRVPIGVALAERDVGAIADSPVILAPLPYVQTISGLEDRVTRIFVQTEPGAEGQVADALRRLDDGDFNVRAANADIEVFEAAATPTKQSTTLFSMLSALVGFLFGLSAVLLTTPYRRGLIKQLQLSGFARRQIRQVLLFDALALGIAGSVLGLALGDLVSRHMFDDVPDYLAFTFSIGDQRAVTWTAVLVAGVAGIVAAYVAVFAPLREALPPTPRTGRSAAGRADRTTWATLAAAVAFGVASVIVVAAPQMAIAGLIALTVGLLLSLPLLLNLGSRLLTRLTRSMSTPALPLAAVELRSRVREIRTIAVAATGALAVFATVSITGARADLQRGLDASTRDNVGNADIWVTFPDAPNVLATTPFQDPRDAASQIEDLPGVRGVRLYRGSLLDVGDKRAWVVAPPREARHLVPPTQIREGDADEAARRVRAGGWAVLSETIADSLDASVGDLVTIPSPRPTRMRVAAVSTNLGWSPGSILLNADDYASAWNTDAASALHIETDPGTAPDAVKPQIQEALGTRRAFQVETRDERQAVHYAASRDGLTRLTQIAILVLVAAVLAMTTAMAGMIWQRRPLLARLKVQGFSNGTLWRALLFESLIVVAAGCGAGAVAGLYGQLLLSRALETITGFPVFYTAAVLVAAGTFCLVTAVALGMLAIPGRIAVRVEPTLGTVRRAQAVPAVRR